MSAASRPSAAQRGLDRLRFGLERLLLRGVGYRLLIAASIVAIVALAGGALVALFAPGSPELGDSVWWAFLRLTDPGYLGDDQGVVRRSVSTLVTLLGYVLFLGLLIAILTQWLNSLISKLESGITPVAVSHHVIILGWTHRTPTIVQELLRTTSRVERFLARRGARDLRIVILAENVDQSLHRELRERLGPLWNDRQILLRSGTPLRLEHLERVAFRDAAVLILPGADFAERNPEAVDAQTVKTLLSVSRHADASDSVPPLAVAELHDAHRVAVAHQAYAGDSEIIVADEILSRLIAQSVWQRGLCSVFSELHTLHEGNALYVRHVDGEAGARFGEIRGSFHKAILLGTVRPDDQSPTLNPHPETVLESEDLLVFVARSFEDCTSQPLQPPSQPQEAAAAKRPAPEGLRRVLILGWSRKVPTLLRQFEGYGKSAFEIDVVSSTPIEERERALLAHEFEEGSQLRQIEAAFAIPGVLEKLEPQSYDNIVLLASERLAEEEHADATTVSTYLMLRGMFPAEGPHPEILVELLEEENEFLFPPEVDVIVSPLLVSYLLSQVSLRRELAAVFAELSRPWGAQIVLQPATEYLPANSPVRFRDLERAATARGEIALGLRPSGVPDAGLLINPDRDAEWTLTTGDEVVVLASYAAPAGAP